MCKKLKPYKDYYLNCYINHLFSILTTVEPSYRKLSYENRYSYVIEETAESTKCFNIEYGLDLYCQCYQLASGRTLQTDNFLETFYYSIPPIGDGGNITDIDVFLERIKSILSGNIVVFVCVDLFYLIENSPMHGVQHKSHYTLVCGYEKDAFVLLDEGYANYGEYKIKQEALRQAIKNAHLIYGEYDYYIHTIPSALPPYQYKLDEIYTNAERLINKLSRLDVNEISISEANLTYFIECLNKIANRQQGNQQLFQLLFQDGAIHESLKSKLIQSAADLQQEWLVFRNTLIRKKLLKGKISSNDISERVKKLLLTEKDLWEQFI